ncbi:uncharacterized protein LOC117910271 [Vitis riparia]|uniref:uncharacterized protein LOC117910271 n=1 Tax=Vitis riparia TaxID=96939 RepID=UPI00155A3ADB|nr:uncharacterized protein LOC117910271 [Vitis riparia]
MDRQQQREQEQGLNSSIEQDQGSSESLEIQVFFGYLSILGVLLAVKYQGGVSVSLFEEHKKIIYIFVIVISIYVATIIVGKKLGTKAIEPIRLLAATIAPILLFFILVPELGWPAFGLWVILAAKMAWDYLQQLYHSLGSWVIIAAKKAWDCVRPSQNNPSDTDQQPCGDLSQNTPSDTDQQPCGDLV